MDYYYTRFDGGNQEGLGSILQSQLHLYAYCKMNNKKMFFPGLKNISHYQYANESSDIFSNNINSFLNIPSEGNEGTIYMDPNYLIREWGELNNTKKKDYISELYKQIHYTGKTIFEKDKTNVSIHIRNINSQDVCFDSNRELYSEQKKHYFDNLIKNIIFKYGKNINLNIFSQGKKEEFLFFEENFDVKLHLNESLIFTFYHLIISDILVTSNSSLSWSAHLYGKNKVVYSRTNFFHSWYPFTFFVDFDGNLL